jgi:predicted glycoside hydrolase/deacetylase ChbG (UPF0249 family)
MVRWPAAVVAVKRVAEYPTLSLGLHVDVGEWSSMGDRWVPRYVVVDLEDEAAVAAEVQRQLDTFRSLVGQEPTHIDSHQHVHRREPLRSILTGTACALGVPLRHFASQIKYCGDFYGQSAGGRPMRSNISPDGLIRILENLPAGITELACHPGLEAMAGTMYSDERRQELQSLTDPRVLATVDRLGIQLRSFSDQSVQSAVAAP